MKYIIITYLILITPVTIAEELVFPSTANEIVKALKSSSTIQKKGLGSIKSDIPLPRVGAIIHFDFDSATIKRESYSLLREYAIALKGGLASDRIEIKGFGESKPLVPNSSKAGMAKNRRVEFAVLE